MKHGDTHNFGRSVKSVGKNWLLKPRSTFWEELFLSHDSRFRDELEKILVDEPIVNCLPRIEFKKPGHAASGTLVEKINVRPIGAKDCDPAYLLEAFGGLLAIAVWFGMEDLHFENIFIGLDSRNGKLLMSPVDIESIFNDLRAPSATGIIPANYEWQHVSGARKISEWFQHISARESIAVACGYIRTSEKLVLHSQKIIRALTATKNFDSAPIRVILRWTRDYLIYLGLMPPETGIYNKTSLRDEELQQLQRGDVPYFFRTIKDQRIRFFSNAGLSRSTCLKNQAKEKKNALPILMPDDIFGIPNRNAALLDFGTLMLAAHFLPQDFFGELRYRDIFLNASKKVLHFQFKDGAILKGPRNWSDHLVSV